MYHTKKSSFKYVIIFECEVKQRKSKFHSISNINLPTMIETCYERCLYHSVSHARKLDKLSHRRRVFINYAVSRTIYTMLRLLLYRNERRYMLQQRINLKKFI